MKFQDEEVETKDIHTRRVENQPVVVRVNTVNFESEVLQKLGRLETKLEMLVGNGQPGRVTLAENKIAALERSDIRRSVYDRIVTATIAFVVSAAVALHDHLGIR